MPALVIDAHPNPNSLIAALAQRYTDAYGDAQLLTLRDLEFDPIMRFGYTQRQELEPDLQNAWDLIQLANHIVIVTPVWWGSTTPLLKGFFDRVLLPHRAYVTKPSALPSGLLKGRTGRVIVTSDSPRLYLSYMGDTTVKHIRRTTLKFCGIKPVKATRFGPVKGSTTQQRDRWLHQVATIAKSDAAKASRAQQAVPDGPSVAS